LKVKGLTGLFWDLDGPILDVSEKYYRVYSDIVLELGGRPLPKATYWRFKRQQLPDTEILRHSTMQFVAQYQTLRRERIESLAYLKYDRVWPEIPPLLARLAECVPLALVTLRNRHDMVEWELEQFGLRSCFRHVLTGAEDGAVPDRAARKVSLVRECLGAGPLSGWFLGDTETDLLAGRMLGLGTVGVGFGIRTAGLLKAAQPDLFVHDMNELVEWLLTLASPVASAPGYSER
jgi:phosphoglycolate phosphatase-like HAD superfamily hydrolase